VIPIETLAGRSVAVFGLGGSGLIASSALFAGGADVVGWDDSAARIAHAASAGIPTADLRELDWSKIAALVLAPGVPLTHPAPHWSVGLARAMAVEVIGDIELFCRERRRHAPDAPFVAITGTNGKSTTTALIAHLAASAGFDTQLGGNIGTAILSLEPPRMGRIHVIECSSFQIDLAPGIDGSAADNDLSYVFRRQPTFYRTLQPVGTIIIDKLQHFLYLIEPNNVALRYGIGLGEQCTELVGLRHVASKAEWPSWQATPDMIARKLAKPGVLAGGPGNPLGARVMELDDGKSRINGTNAPATVGTNVIFGCVRLGNDDVVDLYGRVQNGTAVVVN